MNERRQELGLRLHGRRANGRLTASRAARLAALLMVLAAPMADASSAVPLVLSEALPEALPEVPADEEAALTVGTREKPWIASLEIRSDAGSRQLDDVRALRILEPGERLTEPAVRRALSSLYATGWFTEVEVLARPVAAVSYAADGGKPGPAVAVTIVLRSARKVESIDLKGNLALRAAKLRRYLRLQPGASFEESAAIASRDGLLEAYRKAGYHAAQVSFEVVELSRPGRVRQVRVIFDLEAGPRLRIGSLSFRGQLVPFDEATLRSELRSQVGDHHDVEKLEDDRRRLRRWLVKQGRLAATVSKPEMRVDGASQESHIDFAVVTGPLIEVEVVGLPLRRVKRWGFLPFMGEQPFEESLVGRSCRGLVTHLQGQGHYFAKATYQLEVVDADRQRLVMTVEPGPTFRLQDIRFSGNEQIRDEALLDLLSVTPYSSVRPGSGRLVSEELVSDLENLRSYYLLQGFSEVAIESPEIVRGGENLSLELTIHEGVRRRLVDLTFEGVQVFPQNDLPAKLPLRRGGPFHPLLVDDAVKVLRALYEEEGHADVLIEPRLDWNDEGTLVDVHFVVDEGPQRVVEQLILSGLGSTRSEVVRRFAGLQNGQILSRRRLLEAERDLYRLGIFSRVEVETGPISEASRLTSEVEPRDVVIRLEEGRHWRLAYGVSYHSDDGIGGLFGLTRSNLGGRGDRLQIDVRGSENDRRARFVFDQPALPGLKLPITYALFLREERRPSFDLQESGAQVSITTTAESERWGLVYDYRLVELAQVSVDPAELEREDREVEISSLTPKLFIDRRDDPLDPQRGWSTALNLEWAFPFLRAEADFLKLFWQQTLYRNLDRYGVFAGSFRFGLIEPTDEAVEPDPQVPVDLASRLIPISERFFGGGRTSHRAYGRDELGVLGESLIETVDGRRLEIGGNGLILLNLDYRFPISGGFGGVVFVDYGNVWADWRDVDLGELRLGAGLGVRYRSPIGPVRLEVGWKLNPEPFEDDTPVFFLSFGNPF